MSGGRVTVIGAGSAGISAAVHLAKRGHRATLIERADPVGGFANGLGCKGSDICVRCDVCLPIDRARRIGDAEVITNAEAVDVRKEGDGVLTVLSDGRRIISDAAIVSIGLEPFDATSITRLGLGRVRGVITSLELERAVLEAEALPFPAKRIGFIQCVGSRDLRAGVPYCSKICCKSTAKLVRFIASHCPEAEVTVFRMDWRPYDDPLEEMEELARMVRSRPASVTEGEEGPEVCYADGDERTITEAFDMVVLSVGIRPAGGLEGVPRTALGFIEDADGIFVAGCCREPMDIPESMRDGTAAAERAIAYLEGRT